MFLGVENLLGIRIFRVFRVLRIILVVKGREMFVICVF